MSTKDASTQVRDSLYSAMVGAAGMAVDPSVGDKVNELFGSRIREIADQLISSPPLFRHQENCARRAGRRAAQIAMRDGSKNVLPTHFQEAREDVRAIAHRTLKKVHGENWAVAQGDVCRHIFNLP